MKLPAHPIRLIRNLLTVKKSTMKFLYFFHIFIIIAVSISVSACKKDDLKDCVEHAVSVCSPDTAKTNIRIQNISKYNFCNVAINPSAGQYNYGIVKSGESTCYRSFETAYSYAYIKLYIDGKEFEFQPIDYVGEQELGNGYFTYLLDIPDFNNGYIYIQLQED